MEEKKEKKSKKWIFLVILLLLIVGIGCTYYFYTFEVVIKYNNGLENTVEHVRYMGSVDESILQEHLAKEGYSYKGVYETYILSSEEIAAIKADVTKVGTMCKDNYELDYSNYKCTSTEEFDFINTRITHNTTIEVVWNKNPEEEIPTGKREDAIVILSTKKDCLVGVGNETDFTAKIKGYVKDKTIKWDFPNCYTVKRISDTHYRITRSASCEDGEESISKVSVTLTNGSFDSQKITYEPILEYEVLEGNNEVSKKNGMYKCTNCIINTNTPVTFKANKSNIDRSAQYSLFLKEKVKDTVSIKSTCNQTAKVEITY